MYALITHTNSQLQASFKIVPIDYRLKVIMSGLVISNKSSREKHVQKRV